MAIRFRKSAVKFLAKVSPGDASRLQEKLNQLWRSIEEQGIIPFTDLDIKKMKGDWEGRVLQVTDWQYSCYFHGQS